MEERLHPARPRLVPADDLVAVGAGALARRLEARHLERHVMDARPSLGEEPVEEAVGAGRLEHLDPAAAVEAPAGEAEAAAAGRHLGHAAQDADQHRWGVGELRESESDVVEPDGVALHGACRVVYLPCPNRFRPPWSSTP